MTAERRRVPGRGCGAERWPARGGLAPCQGRAMAVKAAGLSVEPFLERWGQRRACRDGAPGRAGDVRLSSLSEAGLVRVRAGGRSGIPRHGGPDLECAVESRRGASWSPGALIALSRGLERGLDFALRRGDEPGGCKGAGRRVGGAFTRASLAGEGRTPLLRMLPVRQDVFGSVEDASPKKGRAALRTKNASSMRPAQWSSQARRMWAPGSVAVAELQAGRGEGSGRGFLRPLLGLGAFQSWA